MEVKKFQKNVEDFTCAHPSTTTLRVGYGASCGEQV